MLTNIIPIKRVFLIDAFGALLSTLFLGVLLPYYQHLIDLPKNTLYILATIASGLFVNSLSCFSLTLKKPAIWLKTLVLLNLSYTTFTIWILWQHWNNISLLGLGYFIGEIIILVFLAKFEWKSSLI